MDLSFDEMMNVTARGLYSALIRDMLRLLPDDSPSRAAAGNLGLAWRLHRPEAAERHRFGVQRVRQSVEVRLAVERIENALPDQKSAGIDGWYLQAEPALRRGSENLHGDRFVGIRGLLSEIVRSVQERYASYHVPPSVVLQLARVSVAAYGSGFFIDYNAAHMSAPQTQSES